MNDFAGRIAVVTGAAKGIGYAICTRCIAEGMHVLMADIDETALKVAAAQLRTDGASVTPVVTDVADAASVQSLAAAADELDQDIALLFNNAGVTASGDLGQLWNSTPEDWHKLIDVNLWGVINGCMSFLPALMSQDSQSRIVNTASIAGVIPASTIAIYSMTKHAVVSLGESLDDQLVNEGAPVRVSTVCPGFVRTHLVEGMPAATTSERMAENLDWFQASVADGTDPEDIADRIFAGIREERRFIFTHSGFRKFVIERHEAMMRDFDAALPPDTGDKDAKMEGK